jgi:hypothetical protein
LAQALKQEDFEKAWKAFQDEMLVKIYNIVDGLGSRLDKGLGKLSEEQKNEFDRMKDWIRELDRSRLNEFCDIANMCITDINTACSQLSALSVVITGVIRKEVEKGVRKIGRRVDSSLNRVMDSISSDISKKLEELLKESNVKSSDYTKSSFIEIDRQFLQTQVPPSEEACRGYYKGRPASWGIVRDGFAARRKITGVVLDCLMEDDFRSVILTGAGGEGKSTILMQLALLLQEKGLRVFYSSGCSDAEPVSIIENNHEPVALLIDNANELKELAAILRAASRHAYPVKIVLASRRNEWINSSVYKNLGETKRYVEEHRICGIDRDEADNISRLLLDTGTVRDREARSLSDSLLNDSNGFLLAAMITTTHGKPLKDILYSVVERISGFQDSEKLIEALAVVAAVDVIGSFSKERLPCSLRLFTRAMDIPETGIGRFSSSLTGEVSLQTTNNRIETRHETIAAILVSILFDPTNSFYISEKYIISRILHAVGSISRDEYSTEESKLLSVIPLYYLERSGYDFAVELFKAAVKENRLRAETWWAWADVEYRRGNLGEVDAENTARYIFNQACSILPKHFELWRRWAQIEQLEGNMGDQQNEYSARWIAARGALENPRSQHLWCLWAELEKACGNVGDINSEGSARWIALTSLNNGRKGNEMWAFWTKLEWELGNTGETDIKYSARWIASEGVNSNPRNSHLWLMWANLEKEQGRIGDVFTANTARWIVHNGTERNKQYQQLWQFWAELEAEQGNIGDYNLEYTARWAIAKGLEYNKVDQSLWLTWAKMEKTRDNIGSINQVNSARWIAARALDANSKTAQIYLFWAEMERELGNIGSFKEEFSARWLYRQCTDENGLHSVALSWAAMEYAQDNAGSIQAPYSGRWILWKAIQEDRSNFLLWTRFILLEEEQGNTGGPDTEFSAAWLYELCCREYPAYRRYLNEQLLERLRKAGIAG